MERVMLFTDGSVDNGSKIGYGAYLLVIDDGFSLEFCKTEVKVKKFEDTSSTKLELQTLLWALDEVKPLGRPVTVYTDSQNIVGLDGRRKRLEENEYYSAKKRRLNNYKLYQAYYYMTDRMDCRFVKVRGHLASIEKNDIDRLFSIVDRASRNALMRENS